MSCEICGSKLDLYCTRNVCEKCCRAGLCLAEKWCVVKHPEFEGVPLYERVYYLEERKREKASEVGT